jgi:hypothetical protein
MDQYQQLLQQGRAPQLVGQAPTVGNIAPESQAAEVAAPSSAWINYDNNARAAAREDYNSVIGATIPGAGEAIKNASTDTYKNIINNAEAARTSRAPSIQLMTALSTNPETNIFTVPGWRADDRAQASNVLDTIARSLGVGEMGYSFGQAATAVAIANKVNTLRANMLARGAGEKALGALDAYKEAAPNKSMPPDAAAELAAQLMVAQQRQIDQNDFASLYMKDSGGVLGTRFGSSFDASHPAQKYQAEATALKNLMLSPAGRQIFQIYSSGRATSANMEKVLTQKGATPGIGRYFGAGG